MSSFKPVVKVVGDDKWYDNAMRYATEAEAADSARCLFQRWTQATAHAAQPSDDPVNYVRVDHVDTAVEVVA